MKNYAIARIVAWSIVTAICFGVLFAGLSGRMDLFSFPELNFDIRMGYGYSNSDKYTVGGGSVAAKDIQSVEINWISGSVDVVPYDGDTIQFDEEGYDGVDEKYAMRYLVENGKLSIRFFAPQRRRNWRSLQQYRKSLMVKIPRDLALNDFKLNAVSGGIQLEGVRAGDLDINSVSGSINLKDINGDTIILKSVSGHIDAVDISASTLRANTVSGRIDVTAGVESANLNTVSGSVKLYTGEDTRNINVKTISGGITLGLPENDGFTARYSSVSGGFNSEFPVEMSGKRGVYKNGDGNISFETISGGMKIVRR